ncbi:hypothetical protein C1H46_001460 [Malus baccata]|uniref:Uncharacterized protein n=1 Tax=Malus baccata TaxID=106549 RepID=A0A540NP43_MALBA|nr:hypothetical protein C1H46_001460 [Malus baccata]
MEARIFDSLPIDPLRFFSPLRRHSQRPIPLINSLSTTILSALSPAFKPFRILSALSPAFKPFRNSDLMKKKDASSTRDHHTDCRHETKEACWKKASNIATNGEHWGGSTRMVVRTSEPKLYTSSRKSVKYCGEYMWKTIEIESS